MIEQGFRSSPQQGRVWRLHLDGATSPASLCMLRLEGDLDVPALRRALAETMARHEILRTAFRLPAGLITPLQVILEPAAAVVPPLEVVDLRGLAAERRTPVAAELLSALGDPRFGLEQGEVWRVALLRLAPREHALLLALSAACADEGSFEPLSADLFAAYARQTVGGGEAPELPLQYVDVAEWQNSLLETEEIAEGVEAWREHWRRHDLDARLALHLPLEDSEAAPGPFVPREVPVPLARETAGALAHLAGLWGCPLPVLAFAAWNAVIQRGTGREESLAGWLDTGRDAEELRDLVGPLARYLPVASRFDPAAPFRAAVEQVRDAVADVTRRGDLFRWESVVGIGAGNGTGGFPVCFAAAEPGWELSASGLRVAPVTVAASGAAVDGFALLAACRGAGEAFRLDLLYDPRRFRRQAAGHLAGRLSALLASVAVYPGVPLADHAAMAEDELSRWLELSVAPPAEAGRSGETLHALFETQADRTPDRFAVIAGDGRLTFRELDSRANRLAHHLRAAGAEPETPVALCLERTAAAVVALLAVWKAGAAYVPLDPTQPAERLAFLLRDTRAPLLVTESRLAAGLPSGGALPGVRTVLLDEEATAIAARADRRPAGGASPANLAYTIYTSGSTGRPKVIQVEHRSVRHLRAALEAAVLAPLAAEPGGRPGPLRASLNAPMIFDASVQQFALLLSGHTLCVVPQEVRTDGAALLAFLREHEVELLDCTPSQLRLLVDAGLLDGPAAPRIVLTAGEAVDEALWRRLAGAERTVSLNLYGPTECSVDATFHRIAPGSAEPTIGRPLPGYEIFLLNRALQPMPPGAPGELCLGGAGLARGYLRRPDLTAERFVPHPFTKHPGERLYRTGDLGRHLPSGSLEFLGRRDHQVKIRGFRIELGEIEAALAALPGVREAAVAVQESLTEEPAGRKLVAYVVGTGADPGVDLDIDGLRRALRERLPDFMVPAAFVELAALPLTVSGKVDRKALPAPEGRRSGARYTAPRTPVEAVLAGLWAELLGVPEGEKVGVDEHFFDLGGHSLMATRVMARVRSTFAIEMPLRVLF